MNTNIFDWHGLYEAAMLELDPAVLRDRIAMARAAIVGRMEKLSTHDHSVSSQERQAITDALNNLEALERVEFKGTRAGENETQARINSVIAPGRSLGGTL
jgi:hypothetical protein